MNCNGSVCHWFYDSSFKYFKHGLQDALYMSAIIQYCYCLDVLPFACQAKCANSFSVGLKQTDGMCQVLVEEE